MGDKTRRLEALCRWLAERCAPRLGADLTAEAARAGRLSKADLVTGLVGEFDTLQGIMGGIYAGQKGEAQVVAAALKSSTCPPVRIRRCRKALWARCSPWRTRPIPLCCFGLNMVPTGAADPNGLRRCVPGIIRILLDDPGP